MSWPPLTARPADKPHLPVERGWHRNRGLPGAPGGPAHRPILGLAAGTTISLAASVAAAGADLVGRVVADWPAFALLLAVKLLSQLPEPAGAAHLYRRRRTTTVVAAFLATIGHVVSR